MSDAMSEHVSGARRASTTGPAAHAMSATSSETMPATMPDTVLVASRLLGAIPVARDALITMPAGLYGFESCRTFALVAAGRDGLWWLQSAERAELAFLLADPFVFFPGYAVDVAPAELGALEATEETVLTVLVIVTLPGHEGDAASANLRAPIVLDAERRRARQVVVADERLEIAARIEL